MSMIIDLEKSDVLTLIQLQNCEWLTEEQQFVITDVLCRRVPNDDEFSRLCEIVRELEGDTVED